MHKRVVFRSVVLVSNWATSPNSAFVLPLLQVIIGVHWCATASFHCPNHHQLAGLSLLNSPAAVWRQRDLHTFKRQLNAHLFHIGCVDKRNIHHRPALLWHLCDYSTSYKTADLLTICIKLVSRLTIWRQWPHSRLYFLDAINQECLNDKEVMAQNVSAVTVKKSGFVLTKRNGVYWFDWEKDVSRWLWLIQSCFISDKTVFYYFDIFIFTYVSVAVIILSYPFVI